MSTPAVGSSRIRPEPQQCMSTRARIRRRFVRRTASGALVPLWAGETSISSRARSRRSRLGIPKLTSMVVEHLPRRSGTGRGWPPGAPSRRPGGPPRSGRWRRARRSRSPRTSAWAARSCSRSAWTSPPRWARPTEAPVLDVEGGRRAAPPPSGSASSGSLCAGPGGSRSTPNGSPSATWPPPGRPPLDGVDDVKAATAIVIAALGAAVAAGPSWAACDKVTSPRGSNAARGTAAHPYATIGKLAHSLRPGRTAALARQRLPRPGEGCGEAGRGGRATMAAASGARVTVRATARGRQREPRRLQARCTWTAGQTARRCPARRSTGTTSCSATTTSRHATRRSASCSAPTVTATRAARYRARPDHDCRDLHHQPRHGRCARLLRSAHHRRLDLRQRRPRRAAVPDAQRTYRRAKRDHSNEREIVFDGRSAQRRRAQRDLRPGRPLQRRGLRRSGIAEVARRNCLWSTRHAGNPPGVSPGSRSRLSENLVTDPVTSTAPQGPPAARTAWLRQIPGPRRPGPSV